MSFIVPKSVSTNSSSMLIACVASLLATLVGRVDDPERAMHLFHKLATHTAMSASFAWACPWVDIGLTHA